MAEVLDKFIKGEEKDYNLFNLLNESFQKLDDCNLKKEKHMLVYYYFLWNAFSCLGYRSEVRRCASCSGKLISYQVYFSGKEGGIICKNCFEFKTKSSDYVKKINSDVVKILRIILSKEWQILSKLKIDPDTQKLLSDVSENAIHSFCPTHS
jgi:DNA repair protein RecO